MAYRRYRLLFLRAVRTAHGLWTEREGVVVRMEDGKGRFGYGEVAPLPWVDTATLVEVGGMLEKLGDELDAASIELLDESHGCLQFALAAALTDAGRMDRNPPDSGESPSARDSAPCLAPGATPRLPVAALLPAGRAALAAADQARSDGFVVFKWKVGVLGAADEQALLDDLLARLPDGAKLRLDANGAWTTRQAAQWLNRCAERPIEFVEQPCLADAAQGAAGRRRTDDILLGLARDYPTRLALDESVAGLASLRRWLGCGWPGVVVVKPALMGMPANVLALLGQHKADVVFSSALETAVGQRAALRMAFQFKGPQPRALGFGVTPLFRDGRFDGPPRAPFLSIDAVERMDLEAVWNALN